MVVGFLLWLQLGQGSAPESTSPSTPVPSATAGQQAPAPGSQQAPSPGGQQAPSPGGQQAPGQAQPPSGSSALPPGWQPYRIAGTGHRIAYPGDWSVIENPIGDGSSVRFQDGSGRYLLVDWTDKPGPDAAAAWRDLAAGFARGHRNYRQIRIEPTTFRDFRTAAIWEFTYQVGSTDLHAIDFGFADDQHGFALNFQTPEKDWAASQGLFESFEQAFQPEQ